MIRNLTRLLPQALQQQSCTAASVRGFKAVAEAEINFSDRETLKKYVGVRDHLSKERATKGKFIEALRELLDTVKVVPSESGYRQAVEATAQYRLKVCEANDSDAAIEEVLDAHLEELIVECKEEAKLVPLINANKPWDVPAERTVPVFDYHAASDFLDAKK